MAAAVWLTAIAPASYVRLYGFKLYLAQVAIGLTSAAAVFYAACRAIGVDEFNEALAAIGGRFRRRAAASLAP
jgi:hypothetical protein